MFYVIFHLILCINYGLLGSRKLSNTWTVADSVGVLVLVITGALKYVFAYAVNSHNLTFCITHLVDLNSSSEIV